jgi:drug/metabolite transporter (DMT)-like permease
MSVDETAAPQSYREHKAMSTSVVISPAAADHLDRPRAGTLTSSAHAGQRGTPLAVRALSAAAGFWFVVTALGQLILAAHIAGFYGRSALAGRPELWNKILPHGYVSGEPFLNLVLAVHLLFAAVITVGGLLQLIPAIRRRAPAFHRWTGRIYLFAAALMAADGLILVWVRGAVGDLSQHISISLNALLILCCATMAGRYALARRIDLHRRWALRLFLAVSGVWFFRVGLMFWIIVNHGPVGFDDDTFTGPALTILGVVAYLLPQGMAQLYFRAQQGQDARVRYAVAGGLAVLTSMMAVGVVAATAILWLPHM